MLNIQDVRYYYTSDKDKTRLFEPKVGDKFWDDTDPYDKNKCLVLEKVFRDAGFNTRVAQEEDGQWSVAIV